MPIAGSLPRSSVFQGALCAAVLLALCGHAGATDYTYRALNKPLGATACHVPSMGVREPGQSWMSDAGEVLGECEFLVGYMKWPDPATGKTVSVPQYRVWPTVWSAGGSPRVLSLPSGYGLSLLRGMDASGRVVGAVSSTTHVGDGYWVSWQGGQRSDFVLPASLVAKGGSLANWGVAHMGHAGGFLLVNPADGQVATWQGTSVQVYDAPRIPDCVGLTNLGGFLSDAGRVVMGTSCNDPWTAQGGTYQLANGQWQPMSPPLDANQSPYSVMTLGARGETVYRASDLSTVVVDAAGRATPLANSALPAGRYFPTLRVGYLDMNVQGVVVGAGWFPGEPELANDIYSFRATAWIQGKATNLNTATLNLPKGIVLNDAINVNAKGQIFVQGWGSTTGGAAREQLGVLTPR